MAKRKYIRKLRESSISDGYIGADAFGDKTPRRIFICIWSSEPSMSRVEVFVSEENGKKCLCFELSRDISRSFAIKFSKTSTAFDTQGFFWTATKGHHFEIQGVSKESEVFFYAKRKSSRFFHDLLDVIGDCGKIYLHKYMQENFDTTAKNTYAFCIYLQVQFSSDTLTIGKSTQEIYRFENLDFLKKCPDINSLLFEYITENNEVSMVKSSSDNHHILQFSPAPEITEKEVALDVRNVLKDCIEPFIGKFNKALPSDDDYYELVDHILLRLSGICDAE